MILRFLAFQQARFHRLTFVLGTVGLAIAGSRVASDVGELGSWLLTAGSVVLVASSDIGQDLYTNAKRLAANAGMSRDESLQALVQSEAPRWFGGSFILAVLLAAASVFAYYFR